MKSEMEKLIDLLIVANIPFEICHHWINGSTQIFYPNRKEVICDVICFIGSYGGEEGLLETMGLSDNEDDEVEGWQDCCDVFSKIYHDYYKKEP